MLSAEVLYFLRMTPMSFETNEKKATSAPAINAEQTNKMRIKTMAKNKKDVETVLSLFKRKDNKGIDAGRGGVSKSFIISLKKSLSRFIA